MLRKVYALFVFVAVLVVMQFGLHWGIQPRPATPVLPVDRTLKDLSLGVERGVWRTMTMMDESEAVMRLLQARLPDAADTGARALPFRDTPQPIASPVPRPLRLQDRGVAGEDTGDSFLEGSFGLGSGDRTGWGWLADDVQQIRGSGDIDRGGAASMPRRFGDADDGFHARRWLTE